jgi:hypothetical protein
MRRIAMAAAVAGAVALLTGPVRLLPGWMQTAWIVAATAAMITTVMGG